MISWQDTILDWAHNDWQFLIFLVFLFQIPMFLVWILAIWNLGSLAVVEWGPQDIPPVRTRGLKAGRSYTWDFFSSPCHWHDYKHVAASSVAYCHYSLTLRKTKEQTENHCPSVHITQLKQHNHPNTLDGMWIKVDVRFFFMSERDRKRK